MKTNCNTYAGHNGNSGIQNHSCGPHYPVRSYIIGRVGRPDIHVATFGGVELKTCDRNGHAADMDCLVRAKVIADAAWKCRNDGDGCSFYADRDGSPDSGYCVGLSGQETIVDIDDYDVNDLYADCKIRDYNPIFADVVQKLVRNGGTGSDVCIGCWVHNGQRYLDVSVVCADFDDAERLGNANDQIAIYDLNNCLELKL